MTHTQEQTSRRPNLKSWMGAAAWRLTEDGHIALPGRNRRRRICSPQFITVQVSVSVPRAKAAARPTVTGLQATRERAEAPAHGPCTGRALTNRHCHTQPGVLGSIGSPWQGERPSQGQGLSRRSRQELKEIEAGDRAGGKATTWCQGAQARGQGQRQGRGRLRHRWGRGQQPQVADVGPWAVGRVGEPWGAVKGGWGPLVPSGLWQNGPLLWSATLWAAGEKTELVFHLLMENTVPKCSFFSLFYFLILFLLSVFILGNFLCYVRKMFIKTFCLILKYFVFVCSVKSHLFLPLWQLRVLTKAAVCLMRDALSMAAAFAFLCELNSILCITPSLVSELNWCDTSGDFYDKSICREA